MTRQASDEGTANVHEAMMTLDKLSPPALEAYPLALFSLLAQARPPAAPSHPCVLCRRVVALAAFVPCAHLLKCVCLTLPPRRRLNDLLTVTCLLC